MSHGEGGQGEGQTGGVKGRDNNFVCYAMLCYAMHDYLCTGRSRTLAQHQKHIRRCNVHACSAHLHTFVTTQRTRVELTPNPGPILNPNLDASHEQWLYALITCS